MDNPIPEAGSVTFLPHVLPALAPGCYRVQVEQHVRLQPETSATPTSAHTTLDLPPLDETAVFTAQFAVQGERFVLARADIAACFPPDGSRGAYGRVLPHITLTRTTLPWERALDDQPEATPWLAVLLFSEEDPPPDVHTVPLSALQRGATAGAEALPIHTVSYADVAGQQGRPFSLEPGQRASDRCQVIDVPMALFQRLAPAREDLPWLVHGRLTPGHPDVVVITGNRLPAPHRHAVAHLVSLEGLGAVLPNTDGSARWTPLAPDGQPAAALRLVSLARWSFIATDAAGTFFGAAEALDVGLLRQPPLPASDAAPSIVVKALQRGYVALPHKLRDGGRTVSWYRGPLIPFPPSPNALAGSPNLPLRSSPRVADDAVHYDPHTGMFDLSLASAWQLGRLLALADPHFTAEWLRFKQHQMQQLALSVEADALRKVQLLRRADSLSPLDDGVAWVATHVTPAHR